MSAPLHPNSDEAQLRLECVKLAGGDLHHARQIYEFVVGLSDQTPRQRILAALDALEGADAT